MILPLSAIWGGEINYRDGLAQIFDGVFVRNQITTWTQLERTDAFSMFFEFKLEGLSSSSIILAQGTTAPGGGGGYIGDRGMIVIVTSDGRMNFVMQNFDGNRLLVRTAINIIQVSNYYSTLISYDGSSLASGVTIEINQIDYPLNVFSNNLTATIKQPSVNNLDLGAFINGGVFTNFADILLKKSQIVMGDYGNTPEGIEAQIAGSFEGIIPNGNFLLDIDYNKTVAPVTTRPGTPTYAVNTIGGFASTQYLP